MNKLAGFTSMIFFALLIPASNAASKEELKKLYSMQVPGTVIQCRRTDETFFTKLKMISRYTVTEQSENKTKMDGRVAIYATGLKSLRFEAEFKATRTMLDTRDMWEVDPDSLVMKVSGEDAKRFKNKGGVDFFRDNSKLNYDEHSDIRFTTYPDYIIGEEDSGFFTSKGAQECTTRFADSLPAGKAGLKVKEDNSNKEYNHES
ncbi:MULTISPECIES: hypothetical protein [Klebsiella/Raoultella group]|uniref:hypothetical protein n=1 Tax=Klebsiella/Raoultella group TaxID=2890311 RepID=UPI0012B7F5C8|nr:MULTISPECIES: hypothetical protein [Klebsiella/Raoultella group]CAE7358732.1 hypothetical protein AI2614V1_5857 [Klebsiella oxytoca]HBY9439638.1 hypothetical protein [Klebsiella pneumoniae]ELK6574268.1 hypothetical protein [Klebsiella michiganensis]MDV1100135.1 hypothetical protein [Raoultella ornithinolytica]CAH3946112.1 hypothetical protein AI2614V1_5857 [Klebsiella oxytoca]